MIGVHEDQPPEVDIDDEDKQCPNLEYAAKRILRFVSWFGDGEVTGMWDESGQPLYARDLEAVATEVLKEKP